MVSVLDVSIASVSPQESPVDIRAPKTPFYSYWVLIRFGKHKIQSLVDSGQGLPRVEAGSLGHLRPKVMVKNISAKQTGLGSNDHVLAGTKFLKVCLIFLICKGRITKRLLHRDVVSIK